MAETKGAIYFTYSIENTIKIFLAEITYHTLHHTQQCESPSVRVVATLRFFS